MNPKDSSELNVQALLALRQDNDALRVITEKLRVKEMGPSDHIRTKHEAKAFAAAQDMAVRFVSCDPKSGKWMSI